MRLPVKLLRALLISTLAVIVTFSALDYMQSRPAPSQSIFTDATASPEENVAESRHNAITRAVEKVSPAVVSVNVTEVKEYYRISPFANDPFWSYFFPQYEKIQREAKAVGSGCIFSSDGYILTNEHVIDSAVKIMVTLPGGEQYEAEEVGGDYKTDIAVLKIKGNNFPYVEFGDSDDLIIGEWVIALGNPFGLFDISAQPTVTVGVISAINQDFGQPEDDRVYEDMIQTDASINPGNSGGPLVNSLGKVIGMNAFIYTGSSNIRGNIGLGFAIPINRIKTVVADIMEYGAVQRDLWAGIQYNDVTPYIAYYLQMNKAVGVIVSDVDRDSPWEAAGLEPEDVILEIEGKTIKDSKDMEWVKKNIKVKHGQSIKLKVYRNRRIYSAEVKY